MTLWASGLLRFSSAASSFTHVSYVIKYSLRLTLIDNLTQKTERAAENMSELSPIIV